MGGVESNNKEIYTFEQKHEKVKTYNDSRYGEITIYRKKTKKNIIILTKQFWSSDKISQNLILLKHINKPVNTFLFKFLGHFKKTENQFCTDYTKHIIALEFPHKTLQSKIEKLSSQKQKKVFFFITKNF